MTTKVVGVIMDGLTPRTGEKASNTPNGVLFAGRSEADDPLVLGGAVGGQFAPAVKRTSLALRACKHADGGVQDAVGFVLVIALVLWSPATVRCVQGQTAASLDHVLLCNFHPEF